MGYCLQAMKLTYILLVHALSRLHSQRLIHDVQTQIYTLDGSLATLGPISYIQEDIERPGVILGLMSGHLVEFSVRNGSSIVLFANITDELETNLAPFSELRSFYQLHDEILVVDHGLKCVHSLSKDNYTLTTHSGTCCNENAPSWFYCYSFEFSWSLDGTFQTATYAKPTDFATPSAKAKKIYLTDGSQLRQLDLSSQTVTTVFNGGYYTTTFTYAAFASNYVALAGDNGIRTLYSNFTSKDFLGIDYVIWNGYARKKRQSFFNQKSSFGAFQSNSFISQQRYGFKSLVTLTERYLLAVTTECGLSASCEKPQTLALINLETEDMEEICNYGDSLQQYCNDMRIQPNFIAQINNSVLITSIAEDDFTRTVYSIQLPDSSLCPAGYFCPNNTGYEQSPCPEGSYSNLTGLTEPTECLPCDPGSYCSEVGQVAPSGLCDPGYYCSYASRSPKPVHINSTLQSGVLEATGDICPGGHFCPLGSTNPLPCLPGTYQPRPGSEDCLQCPAGYYCPDAGMNDYLLYECPLNHYCPEGSNSTTRCDPDIYNAQMRAANHSWCLDCDSEAACVDRNTQHTNVTTEKKPETHLKLKYPVLIGITAGSICLVIVVSWIARFTYKRFMSSKELYSFPNPGHPSAPTAAVNVESDETINMTEAVTQDGRPPADTIYCEIDDEIYDTINDSDITSSCSSLDTYYDGTETNQNNRLSQIQPLPTDNSTVNLETLTQDDNIVYVEDPACADDIIYVENPSCVDASVADTSINIEAAQTIPVSID